MIIGAQLYTTRGLCKTLEGLSETLARVADIGYTTVQISGVCEYDPAWMAAELKKNGLTGDITHTKYAKIRDDCDAVIAAHDVMNCCYIGVGSNANPVTPEGLQKMEEELRPAIAKIAAAGHKFMYHNHHKEFARFGGKTFLDLLCETFTPDECGITFDTYWAMAGGADPVEWLGKLRGRVDVIHMKDMVYSPEDAAVRMACVGEGNMNYKAILRAAVDAGTRFAYVEQDHCYDEDPIECLRRSYQWLTAQGLY